MQPESPSPTLKRWAILGYPSGTNTAFVLSNPSGIGQECPRSSAAARLFFVLSLTILLVGANCLAESPAIKYLSPSALVPGRTTELIFFGNNLAGATNLWASFECKAMSVRCGEDRAVFSISVRADYPTGLGA